MDFTREMSDEEIQDAIADRLRAREFAGRLNVYERARMGKELFSPFGDWMCCRS